MAIGNARARRRARRPAFIEHVARIGLLAAASGSPSCKDAHRDVIEEMRGEGLMIGLKLKVAAGDFAAAARAEKLLTIPAGDNVVRLLPPLIITDEELAEGVRRLDAACVAAEAQDALAPSEGAAA